MNTTSGVHENDSKLSGMRILVVEDEFLLAELVRESLSEKGAHVIGPAGRIKQAMEFLASEDVDFALLDSNIHGCSIMPVAELLQQKGTPFAFLSGYRRLEDLRARFPKAPVFEKPVAGQVLEKAIVELMRHRIRTARLPGRNCALGG